MVRTFCAALGLLVAICEAAAAESHVLKGSAAKSVLAVITTNPPTIDGVLDDPSWQDAKVVDDFHQIVPTDGGDPTEETIVRVLYDRDYLYVSAELRDSDPRSIRASQLIQGKTFPADDRFWVTVDSFHSRRSDYFFQVNANSVRREGLRENNTKYIEEWDAIWYVSTKITDDGWIAEIAIPFKSISFDPTIETWGINFGRGITRKQEFMMWSSFERQDWPAYAGDLVGIRGIDQGRGIDVVTSAIASKRTIYSDDIEDSSLEPSADVLFKLSPNLTGTITVNTDFSGTEVDDRRINLDRFTLFVPEKRTFFLQDAGIFEFADIQFNGRPFFSRRIGLTDDGLPINLIAGGKLTGRIGRFDVGALSVRQDAADSNPERNLSVARLATNFFRESSAGIIATHGDPTSNQGNSLFGADILIRSRTLIPDRILAVVAWAQESNTEDVSGNDSAFGLRFDYPNDRFAANLDLREIQGNFNPGLGFINRRGIKQADLWTRYRVRPSSSKLREYDMSFSSTHVESTDGDLLTRKLTLTPAAVNLHSGDRASLSLIDRYEKVDSGFQLFNKLPVPAGSYGFQRARLELSSSNHRTVSGRISLERGEFFGGTLEELVTEIEWRQSKHLFLSLFFSRSDTTLPSGSFIAKLTRFQSSIAFNANWSFSALLQHDNESENLGLSARLLYTPKAGQELLFVVNHAFDATSSDNLRSLESEIVLRAGYTFRY